jgi:hypothetical protein
LATDRAGAPIVLGSTERDAQLMAALIRQRALGVSASAVDTTGLLPR